MKTERETRCACQRESKSTGRVGERSMMCMHVGLPRRLAFVLSLCLSLSLSHMLEKCIVSLGKPHCPLSHTLSRSLLGAFGNHADRLSRVSRGTMGQGDKKMARRRVKGGAAGTVTTYRLVGRWRRTGTHTHTHTDSHTRTDS
jgi:hypothetical protein